MNRFEYTDPDGDRLVIVPDVDPNGRPTVIVTALSGADALPVFVSPDHVEEVVAGLRDMARQTGQQPTADPSCQCLPASPVEGPLTCDPHLPAQPAEALTVAERQFLSFALDLAFDRMADRGDEFTAEDHAALDRFRRMTTEEPQQPAPVAQQPPVDRAALYRALADEQDATATTDVIRRRRSIATARRLFAVELRRKADEADR